MVGVKKMEEEVVVDTVSVADAAGVTWQKEVEVASLSGLKEIAEVVYTLIHLNIVFLSIVSHQGNHSLGCIDNSVHPWKVMVS